MHIPKINNRINKATDFALVELDNSANICSRKETKNGKCWNIEPVILAGTSQSIPAMQTVTTLGMAP